jgi:phosphatidate cytidylyltransferase
MLTRALSSVLGIALFLALCFGGLLPFTIGVTLLAALGLSEFIAAYRSPAPAQASTSRNSATSRSLSPLIAWLGVLYPLLAYAEAVHFPSLTTTHALLLVLFVGLFALVVPRYARTGKALGELRSAYGLVGHLYVGFLFSGFVLLRGISGQLTAAPFGAADRGAWLMLFVAVCVWATDTSAYCVGRSLGRHKLAPSISPGKTLEGAVGGLLGAMAAGAAFSHGIHLPLTHGLAIGTLAGAFGQVGDLCESALKREVGIKDFGRALPGHGGALDRFDSLLFVAPLAYLYLRLVAGF